MSFIKALILGVIQGLTEFLPVSSSGHLVLAQHFMKVVSEENLFFDVLLHLGSVGAILVIYRKDIIELIANLFSKDKEKQNFSLRYALYVVIGCIPVGLVGVLLGDQIETIFTTPIIASALLFVTAIMLILSRFAKDPEKGKLTWKKAAIIGLAQAITPLPGISRSGTTITTALLCGVSREEAGRFSFLMALPAIMGAALLEIKDIESISISLSAISAGFIGSFITGILALVVLLKFVKQGKLHIFAWYCGAIGLISGTLILMGI